MEEIKTASDEVSRYLNDIGSGAEKRDNPIWTLKGDWTINHKVCEMIDSAKKEVEIICVNNRHLIRYAKYISEASKTKSITVVISHQPESFLDLLGSSRIMKFKEFWQTGKGPKIGAMSERGSPQRTSGLSMICQSDRALLRYSNDDL